MFIKVKVSAGASLEKMEQKKPDQFIISVRELAQHNLANQRVGVLLASHFGVPIGAVRLISGHHRPSKIFDVPVPERQPSLPIRG